MTDSGVADTRRRAYGVGRVLIAVYGVFAVSATARASVQLIRDASQAPVAYSLSAFAAAVYVVATIALAHNGRRMRRVAWVAVVVELIGVVSVGVWSFVDPAAFPEATVWSHFGQGYAFVPLVLPILGIAWLVRSNPAALARA
ncbi:hypothetical protein [Serinibacter salmoneus]|uniref:Integral membrane protein n=1 Tax=Serinibacter salmoneus TaxID=556530 RepID=A0A2A9CZR8_9MICO|nr:hypothetical protein [Serinibacter salmoneus]PFG19495.1 hypothetical protein ATL40_1059 [Serinibacter salmoneus]